MYQEKKFNFHIFYAQSVCIIISDKTVGYEKNH